MKRTERVKIAVVNHSKVLTDEDVAAGVAALQKQVSRDFAPVWNVDATLRFVASDDVHTRLPAHWGLVLADDHGHTRQLGYHELTTRGLPLGTIHVLSIPKGCDWTHTASHELLEMLADPDSHLAVCLSANGAGYRVHAREVCDPCAGYEDGYVIDGRQVSDFVFPNWFQPDAIDRPRTPGANGRFDERGLIQAPFQVRPGGYIAMLDLRTDTWELVGCGSETPVPVPGATRLRNRKSGRTTWQTSDMSWSP